MALPDWLNAWITAQGVNADELAEYLKELGDKIGLPGAADAISLWLEEHIKEAIAPERLIAVAMLIVAELKSGKPGMFDDHAGLLILL